MITLLALGYVAICVIVFKIFRLKASSWSISTALLGGLFGVGGIMIALNYNHPFSPSARIMFFTTPIFSTVIGRVIDVPIKPNVVVRRGTILFRLDDEPFKDTVEQRKAQVAQAQQNVHVMQAAVGEAQARQTEAAASRDRAWQAYERYRTANENARAQRHPLPFSELDEANRKGEFDQAEGALTAAKEAVSQAQLKFESSIGGVNTEVARAQASLKHAEFELDEATVRAPSDGYATQLFLRPGMAAMPMPIRPVMVFVHSDQNLFVASFPQNVLQRVRAGCEAEIAFDGIPGRVFEGRVDRLIETVAQGQLQPSGDLVPPEMKSKAPGETIAVIDILDDMSAFQLPAGATAQVAVYTDHWRHLAVVRRILLRMKSWLNYLTIQN